MTNSNEPKPAPPSPPVAIIGMACLFPKAPGIKQYWRLLWRGQDAIGPVPPTHWSAADYFDPDPKAADRVYCTRGGYLDPVDFDPAEFGIPPSSLEATDTSQLLSLLAARMALTDAGYGPGQRPFDRQRTSVILGVTGTQELVIPLAARLGHPHWRRAMIEAGIDAQAIEKAVALMGESYVGWQESSFPGLLGNVVAGRICNRFDLGGTNCAVDAACASSFSALQLALLELWSGRSRMAITGGADLLNDIFMHMCFAKSHILSASGDARPFAKAADGTVLGEGVGLVVIKPLEAAESDGDRIYAVIRGIGASSDGRSSSIYAPRKEGQVEAIGRAYASAAVDPATVEMIEAHGTGTRVGDQVEVSALREVFQTAGGPRCALGSVKSMIGHAKAAAGAAGLIKAALALHHKVLPPTLKVDEPDPGLKIEDGPFYLNTAARPWTRPIGHPRRCGVSAFGFGGSNFHVVLEEHRASNETPAWDGSVHILALSAADRKGLNLALDRLIARLGDATDRAARVALAGRTAATFDPLAPLRLTCAIGPDTDPLATLRQVAAALEDSTRNPEKLPKGVFYGDQPAPGKLAVLFPGQGSQYPQMGRDLVCVFPEARQALESIQEAVAVGQRLGDLIYPPADFTADASKRQATALQATDRAQPAIGALSAAWYRVLQRFGLSPAAVAGHSFGELTALWAAGRIDTSAFAGLAAVRGEVMAAAGRVGTDPGTMLAVKAPLEQLDALPRPDSVILANRNSPRQGVFSGPTEAITALEKQCRDNGLRAIRLQVAAAFHSRLVAEARKPFADAVHATLFAGGNVPVYGNTHAVPYPEDPEQARRTLADQMLQPVDFVGVIEHLYADGCRTFLEVGPKAVLTGLTGEILGQRPHTALAVDRSGGRGCGIADLALTLAQLAAMGYEIDLSGWEQPPAEGPEPKMKVTLSGANYRGKKQPGASPTPQASRAETPAKPESMAATPARYACRPAQPAPFQPPPSVSSTPMTRPDPKPETPSASLVAETLKSVQAGLKAIESMQARTTDAHRKFLEVQQEASRTLQQMMASAGQMSQALLGGLAPLAAPAVQPAAAAIEAPPPAPLPRPAASRAEEIQMTAPPEPKAVETAPSEASRPATPPAAAGDSGVLSTLMAVVSELTGYPVEMLGAEMDIEADLGIDSIKRVEILSALEERLPGQVSVSAEQIGTLKTLGDIAAILGSENPDAAVLASKPDRRQTGPAAAQSTRSAPKKAEPAPEGNVLGTLMAVVSELTGYPVEMLGAEMDIEADLGIDSIKRVEILSALEERLPGQVSVSADQIGTLKTLGDIAAILETPPDARQAEIAVEPVPAAPAPAPHPSDRIGLEELSRLAPRQIVRAVPCPRTGPSAPALAADGKMLIAGDDDGLGPQLARSLAAAGFESLHVPAAGIAAALAGKEALPPVSALVIVGETADPDHCRLKQAFALVRHLADGLTAAAKRGGALLATVSRLDGGFGFLGRPVLSAASGALAGLAKTAALELEGVTCRALDIGGDFPDAAAAAAAIAAEFASWSPQDPVEIGICPDGRHRLVSEPAPYHEGELALKSGDPVVVSGGARGVTAEALLALAREVQPVCIILGRSPLPGPEPEWMAGLATPAQIRQALLKTEFAGREVSPRELADRAARLAAEAEIRGNLKRFEEAGATVEYRSVDVRQAEPLRVVLDEARRRHGPIRALIHGAGTLADRRIADKTDAQFAAVFDTKVRGLENLLALTADDPLRYVVLFSSVAARLGNAGQVDYAMANEVLNKTALHLARRRRETRVLAINWGPWDGGMVDAGLRRHFAARGVALLPPAAGAEAMVRSMADPSVSAVEIVVGSDLAPVSAQAEAEAPAERLELAMAQEVDLERFPVLADHVLAGRPVVPLALMIEWLGHTALHANPGLNLVGLDDLRVLSGIKLDAAPHPVKLMIGPSVRRQGVYEVPVALYNGNGKSNGSGPIHSRARALLAESALTAPPAPPPPGDLQPFPFSLDEAYDRVLFHGKRLRGIRRIEGCSATAMVAQLAPAPAPERWVRQPLRRRWITDPLILDAAFQMAILWSYARLGTVSLPSYAAGYRQYCKRFPADGVTAELRVESATASRLKADILFYDKQRRTVAMLSGYEATLDPGLSAAFKNRAA